MSGGEKRKTHLPVKVGFSVRLGLGTMPHCHFQLLGYT